MTAIIIFLKEFRVLGCDPRYVCWRAVVKSENFSPNDNTNNLLSSGQSVYVGVDDTGGTGGGGSSSSVEEVEDEEKASTSSVTVRQGSRRYC